MKIKLTTILLISFFITSCSTVPTPFMTQQKIDPTNIDQLENLSAKADPTGDALFDTTQIRTKALKDTAMSLGAQGGLATASKTINERLEKDKWHLETIYNFNGMILSHGVLPPVLVESNSNLNLSDPNTIRVSDKTYKIVVQARFATTPPNWREYLWMNYKTPEIPHRFMMPRNNEEKRIWKKAIRVGWEKGHHQASSIFQQNLARLKRDYNGMILYRRLLQHKMVSAPYVSRTELGITGDGSDMHINDQVLRITELPKLQTNSDGWKAIVVKQHG